MKASSGEATKLGTPIYMAAVESTSIDDKLYQILCPSFRGTLWARLHDNILGTLSESLEVSLRDNLEVTL